MAMGKRRLRAEPSVTKYSAGSRRLTSVWKKDLSGARNMMARVSLLPDRAASQSFSTGRPLVVRSEILSRLAQIDERLEKGFVRREKHDGARLVAARPRGEPEFFHRTSARR